MGFAVVALHVVVEDDFELVDDVVAFESGGELAVDVDRGLGFFEGAGQRDADVGVLGFAGAVHDAAHDGELHLFNTGVELLPLRHRGCDVVLHLLGQHLEVGGGGAPAAGAACDLRCKAADGECLQDLLGAADLFTAVAAGRGRKRDANGIADAFEQQRSEAGGGGYCALHAHAGFGESEVQCVVATRGEFGVDVDEVAHAADLCRKHNLVAAQAVALCRGGVIERGANHRLQHNFTRGQGIGGTVVLVHHLGE